MADLEWLLDVGGNAKSVLADVDAVLAAMPKDLTKVEAGLKAFDRAIAAANIAKINDPLRQNAALLKLHAQALREDAAEADKGAAAQKRHEDALRRDAQAAAKAAEAVKLAKAKEAAAHAKELGNAIENAFGLGQIAQIASVAGAIDMVAGATKGALSFLGHGAIELFKFGLEAQQGKRAMLGMLQVFEGAGTDNAFATMQEMGIAAGVSADKMVNAFAGLRQAGFNAKESQDILAASLDISAARGGGEQGKAAADKFQDLFVKFNALGKVGSKDLLALARDVGVDPTKQLPEALAARMKVPVEQAIKLLDAGKADAKTVENALLDIVQKDINKGGKLGDRAKDFAAGDVASQLQRIKDLGSNLFEDANFKPVAEIVKSIADNLKLAGDRGELKALAERFVGLLGGVEDLDVRGALEKVITGLDAVVSGAERVKAGFGEAFHPETFQQTKELLDMVDVVLGKTGEKSDSIHGIGVAFGMVANHIAMSVALLEKLIELAARAASSIAGAVQSIGQFGGDVGGGFAKGIEQGDGGAVWDAAVNMAKLPLKAVAGTLDIQSPSREMAKLGAYAGEGFSEGLEDESPSAALAAAVSTPTISTTTNNSSRGGVVVNLTFGDIIGGGEPGRVREDARAGVLEALEELGYS